MTKSQRKKKHDFFQDTRFRTIHALFDRETHTPEFLLERVVEPYLYLLEEFGKVPSGHAPHDFYMQSEHFQRFGMFSILAPNQNDTRFSSLVSQEHIPITKIRPHTFFLYPDEDAPASENAPFVFLDSKHKNTYHQRILSPLSKEHDADPSFYPFLDMQVCKLYDLPGKTYQDFSKYLVLQDQVTQDVYVLRSARGKGYNGSGQSENPFDMLPSERQSRGKPVSDSYYDS